VGEQAVQAALLEEDTRRLGRGLAHGLGLDRPVEHLAVPRQDLLLHRRVHHLRMCTHTIHTFSTNKPGRIGTVPTTVTTKFEPI
jgi:hypothetical protein